MIDPMTVQPVLSQASTGLDTLLQFFPFIMIFVIMYFLILRPQQQKLKAQQEMLKNIRRGDTIVLGGGLIGRVTKVTDGSDEVEAEIATGVKIRAVRSLIVDVRAKGEPVKGEPAKVESGKGKASKPETSKPETSKPDTIKPEASKPETAGSSEG